ncbi:sulfite exporter TauE/SafE family protein [Sporosarcina gallistercoris]|uniref:Probable membrane transporter protein n=1 Tax=Sporosarcina gallistercoris TaxID=2762245 RepID=A0ABR8PK27_9BACL|nr:sulfite exporter TauE/SafE family protein [Sporosarcina gallistercoris]MBD7908537.1 sulfite exporter TauE/SafE family protein [Sporosarcina gallistercoris]
MSIFLFCTLLLINLVVGIFLGISGIAGFLLPLIYVGFLNMPVHDSLALSFLAFAVSGVLGAYSYWKMKHMDLKLAILLSIGSLPGAFLGVQINVLTSDFLVKFFLYLFVLFAGLSLLIRKDRDEMEQKRSFLLNSHLFVMLLGFLTAVICSLTGAGGPILLVPLLASLGVHIRVAVGVSLLNSVIIALPSMAGYFSRANMDSLPVLIIASLLGTVIGILTGTRIADKVPIPKLKLLIAVLTIVSSIYMLAVLVLSV